MRGDKHNDKQKSIDGSAYQKPVEPSLDSQDATLGKNGLLADGRYLADVLSSIGDGVIATDIEGKVTLINKSAEVLTGWTEESAIGRPLGEVLHVVSKKLWNYDEIADMVLKAGETLELTNGTILIAKDGVKRLIAGNGTPLRNSNNEIIGMTLTFRDVTEEQKMEEEFLKVQKFESIGVLAGGIAHDFNNILTAIMGNITLAKLGSQPKDILERLAETEKALSRAKDLTQRLLAFSKDGVPIVQTTDIAELLKQSVNFVLSGSNIRCEFSLPNDLWLVEVDEGQINQVISNIVINASQAMPEGGTIKVYAENVVLGTGDLPCLKAGKYVKISIKDHGIGIPEENLPKIFDPYFTTKKEGSGLGLAVSLSIVRKHDGHIAVESRLGVGTTFHIYLPASPEKVLIKKRPAEERFIQGKGKILIVDDESTIRELVCRILGSFGYETAVAEDGSSAIELYKSAKESGYPFDAVIMDLTIPGGMGAKETIQILMRIDPEVKAIVSSGYSNDPIITNFRKYGFCGAISKPYGVKELSETLNNVLYNGITR